MYMYVCIYIYIYIHTCIHIYVCVYVYICVYIYIYIHPHQALTCLNFIVQTVRFGSISCAQKSKLRAFLSQP